jgi:hypothetical protein
MSLTKVSYSMINGSPASILDFGAVGDGVTDDSAAIQAAVNASDTIYFPTPSVQYYVASAIIVPDNKTLFGDYVYDGNVANTTILANAGITVFNVQGNSVKISGIGIAFNSATGNFSNTSSIGILVRNVNSYGAVSATWEYVSFVDIIDCTVLRAYKSIQLEAAYWCSINNTHTKWDFHSVVVNLDQYTQFTAFPLPSTTIVLDRVYSHGTASTYSIPVGGYASYLGGVQDLSVLNCAVDYFDTAIYVNRSTSTNITNQYVENVNACFVLISPFGSCVIDSPFTFQLNPATPAISCSFESFTLIGGKFDFSSATGSLYVLTNGASANIYGPVTVVNGTAGFNSVADDLVIDSSGSNGLTIASGTSSDGSIHFADGKTGLDAYRGQIFYSHTSNTFTFSTNAVARLLLGPTGDLFPNADNTQSLGGASNRWSVVYAGTGAINTSDEREKQDFAAITEAERQAAQGIKSLIKSFKFKDAVVKKGDGARIHFGVSAQQVAEVFKTVGLDPNNYALFCYDEWDANEEQGIVAGNRYGIRYDELLAFVISAL